MPKEVIDNGDNGIAAPENEAQEVTTNNIATDAAAHRIGALVMADGSTSILDDNVFATDVSLSGSAHPTFNGNVRITDILSATNGELNFGPDSLLDLSHANPLTAGAGIISFYGTADITGAKLIMGAGKFNFYGETTGGVVALNEGTPSVIYDEAAFPMAWDDDSTGGCTTVSGVVGGGDHRSIYQEVQPQDDVIIRTNNGSGVAQEEFDIYLGIFNNASGLASIGCGAANLSSRAAPETLSLLGAEDHTDGLGQS